MRGRRGRVGLALLLLLALPVRGHGDEELRRRLTELERAAAAKEATLAERRRQAAELAAVLERLGRERQRLAEAVATDARRLAELKRRRRRLERRRRELERRLRRERVRARRAAAWLLSLREGGAWELALGGGTLERRRRARGTARVVLARLTETIRTLAAAAQEAERTAAELAQVARERERTLAQRRRRLAELEALTEERRRALALLKRDAALAERTLADLQRARRQLLEELTRGGGGGSRIRPGALPWPVGDGELLLAFGKQRDPVFEVPIDHPGWTLRVPKGTPVRAVASGEVVYAGWLRGYGNLVVIRHADGLFSLYGYLDSLAVRRGDRVVVGQEIGRSGDSGSLYGPALHFELRRGKEPLDPARYLAPRG